MLLYTQGDCCESHADGWTATYNATFNRQALLSAQSAYSATATAPLLNVPNTSVAPTTTTETSSTVESTLVSSTATGNSSATTATGGSTATPGAAGPANNAAAGEQSNTLAAGNTGAAKIGKEVSSSLMIGGALGAAVFGMLALF